MVMCWAPDCKHYNVRETCKFFAFPKLQKERSKWIKLLRRDVAPGPGAYVCSCHFRDGKKENGPELFLHNRAKRSLFVLSPPRERKCRLTRKEKSISPSNKGSTATTWQKSAESVSPTNSELGRMGCQKLKPVVTTRQEVTPSTSKEISPAPLEVTPTQESNPSTSLEVTPCMSKTPQRFFGTASQEAENYFLRQKIEEQQKIIKYMSVIFCYENIQGNDKLIVLYTGLPSKKIFESLFTLIEHIDINYYLGWRVVRINKIDQLLLTLMKLRLNSPHLDLAHRFGVSSTAVTNIFLTFVHLLHEILYEQLMAKIPSRLKNRSCLPSSFSNFTNCRIVLDCTEIFTEISRRSMKTQKATYSSYKHRNTYKGLIGVAPNGVVTYASDLYPGSISDQKIVENCGIMSQFEAGDLILADKGFLVQNILPQGVSLNIPPFLRSPQFTPEQVRITENIAKARIHVERAIRRIKCYRILYLMSESLCPFGDVIFKTIAALTNLQYPLIKDIEELFSHHD